jgi:predicted nucleotidyltransferase
MRWRRTEDLDVTVVAPVEELETSPLLARGWRRDAHEEQRWHAPGAKVDIVPCGAAAHGEREVVWPRSGARMSLVGFRHLLSTALPVEVGGLSVRVAPAHVLLLLKVIASLDRPWDRRRDLQDLAWLLEEAVGAADPRRFERFDELIDEGIAFEHAGAYMLGRELGGLLDEVERGLLNEFVRKARDEGDRHASGASLVTLGPVRRRRASDEPSRMLDALERGLRTRHEAVR